MPIFKKVHPFRIITESIWVAAALMFLVVALALTGCKKESQPPPDKAAVKFYSTNMVTAVKTIVVSVGGQDCGRLKYSGSLPTCADMGYTVLVLSPGRYTAHYVDVQNPAATKDVVFVVAGNGCLFFDLK